MSSLFPPPFLIPPLLHLISGYPDQLLALEQVSTEIGEKVRKNLCWVNIPLLDQLSVWLNNLLTHRPKVCSIHSQEHTARFQNWVHTVVPKSCMSNMLSAKEYAHGVVSYLEKEQKSNIIIQVWDVARAAGLGIHEWILRAQLQKWDCHHSSQMSIACHMRVNLSLHASKFLTTPAYCVRPLQENVGHVQHNLIWQIC